MRCANAGTGRSRRARAIASMLAGWAVMAPVHSQPVERFVARNDLVEDRQTGLVWQRCSWGQHWQGRRGCVGLARKLSFDEAAALQDSRWSLPTVPELQGLFTADLSALIAPAAFPDAPATWYWALDGSGAAAVWGVSCGAGGNDSCYQNSARAVRLVHRPAAGRH
jgi:hypothetical protein